MQSKLPVIILTALVLIVGAYMLQDEQQPQPDPGSADQRLLPELEQKLNDITRIRIEHSGDVYELVKQNDQWQLPDKGGYPVLFETVKPFLLGIALLDKVEPKTDKPKNYARLGVQEPAADTANTRIELYAAGDDAVASFIVGGIRSGLISGGRDGIYVRVSGDLRAWLVAGNLNLPEKQVDWVDRQIIHIKPKTVKRVTIKQPDGSRLVVEKAYQGAPGFAVMNMPKEGRAKNPSEVNALARSLAALKMEDVRVRPPAGPPESEAVTAVFETWKGLQVSVTTTEQGRQSWAWFDLAGATATAADGAQERFVGWVFQLPRSSATKLRARLIDLKDAESPVPPG